jgi:hypothetical protein
VFQIIENGSCLVLNLMPLKKDQISRTIDLKDLSINGGKHVALV